MKKKLNILMISKSLPDSFKGGIQTHVWALSKWLQNLGHDVTILAGGEAWKRTYAIQNEGRKIVRIPFFPGRRMPFLKKSIEEFAFCIAAYQWVNKHGSEYDIIHIQGRSGAWIPKRLAVRTVATYHGLIRMENQSIPSIWHTDSWLHSHFAKWLEQLPLTRTQSVIYVSNEIKSRVKKIYGKTGQSACIIHNGIERATFTDLDTKDPNELVFVGRLHPVKGLESLIEAISMVDVDVACTLIGDGPMRTEIEKLIQTKKLEHKIKLLGSLSHLEVMQMIRKSHALILPSFYETQGIVLMEANVQGIPVLASNINGINEVVKHGFNGLLFEAGNSKDMAHKITELFTHPEKAHKMGECGKKFVIDKFHWSKIAKDTEQLYYNALAQ